MTNRNTLYVGGLPEDINEEIIRGAFIPFGDIVIIKLTRTNNQ